MRSLSPWGLPSQELVGESQGATAWFRSVMPNASLSRAELRLTGPDSGKELESGK